MRIAAFQQDDQRRVGVIEEGRVRALPVGCETLDALREDREWVRQALRDVDVAVPLASARLLAPLPDPPALRDFMTFEQHVAGAAMMADPAATVPERWYAAPAFYFTSTAVIAGPEEDIPVPPASRLFDLELEVAAVIADGGSDLTPQQAQDRIAGYVLMNDWSARDIQFAEMEVRLGPAKGKDGATSLGPYVVSADEMAAYAAGDSFDIDLVASINGRVLGRDNLTSMAFSFGQMVAYASRGSVVRAGEVFGSGTCGGGCLAELWGREGFDAHRALAPGDLVSIDGGPLGTLTSRLVPGTATLPDEQFTASVRRS